MTAEKPICPRCGPMTWKEKMVLPNMDAGHWTCSCSEEGSAQFEQLKARKQKLREEIGDIHAQISALEVLGRKKEQELVELCQRGARG